MAQRFLIIDYNTGRIKEAEAITVSTGSADAGKIVALNEQGKLDMSLLPAGIEANVKIIKAVEDISAGMFVNIYKDGTDTFIRKADALINRPAHGYILEGVTAGDEVMVYFDGFNDQLSALTPGKKYFLVSSGQVSDVPPTQAGAIIQIVGKAVDENTIDVEIAEPIEILGE